MKENKGKKVVDEGAKSQLGVAIRVRVSGSCRVKS